MFIGQGLGLGDVNRAVAVLRGSVDGVEFERRGGRCIDQVVFCSGRDDNRGSVADRMRHAIKHHRTVSRFHAEELVEVMYFFTNIFVRVEVHDHELAMLGGMENRTKIRIGERNSLYIVDVG